MTGMRAPEPNDIVGGMADTENDELHRKRTVADLQRELLAVCRGGVFEETWRKVNAIAQWPSLKGEIGKLAHINALRRQIVALDPKAALYYGWGGPGDEEPTP